MKLFRFTTIAYSSYVLITALWALIDIHSFMIVTGYKTDVWLVKTVSVLLLCIGITLLSYLYIPSHPLSAGILGGSCCVALMTIDFYYVYTDVIAPVYLLDGVLEFIFLVAWIYVSVKPGEFAPHKNVA